MLHLQVSLQMPAHKLQACSFTYKKVTKLTLENNKQNARENSNKFHFKWDNSISSWCGGKNSGTIWSILFWSTLEWWLWWNWWWWLEPKFVLELNNWVGVAPSGFVVTPANIWGVCWGPAPLLPLPPLWLVPPFDPPPPVWCPALEGTGCVKLLLDTLLDSLELEAWQDAEVGVARVTQGWIRTSSVVSLCVGSFLSKHRIKHLALELILSGRVNWPRRILANRPVCSWPWNGYLKKKYQSISKIHDNLWPFNVIEKEIRNVFCNKVCS